jgi:ABC-type polysaccharide/polyol phosphate transport system ATPase subunit
MEGIDLVKSKIFINDASVIYDALRFRGFFKSPSRLKFTALKNINLNCEKGEIIAVMGHNGAGKTTLLKLISAKLRPSSGKIETFGDVIHLAGVNPGFDKFLSARQNIAWLSEAYGIKSDISSDIESFADIGEAFDRPITSLSTGMQGRVGFGFATALKPEILLIDEVLGVGDPSFKSKAMLRLKEMLFNSGIVIMSTHSVGLVKEIATRCIVLEGGKIIYDGEINKGLELYASMGKGS